MHVKRPSNLVSLYGKLYKSLKPYGKPVRGSHGTGRARILEKDEIILVLDAYMEDFGIDYLTVITVYNIRTMKTEEITISTDLNEKEEFFFFFEDIGV